MTVEKHRDQKRGLHVNDRGEGERRQRDHETMNSNMQEYNKATNGNKDAYIILDVHISAVFDKILDNRQVIISGSHMHGRLVTLQQQYHHTTQRAVAVVTVGK